MYTKSTIFDIGGLLLGHGSHEACEIIELRWPGKKLGDELTKDPEC